MNGTRARLAICFRRLKNFFKAKNTFCIQSLALGSSSSNVSFIQQKTLIILASLVVLPIYLYILLTCTVFQSLEFCSNLCSVNGL